MKFESKWLLTDKEKDNFIAILMPNLTVLRTKAEISQEELANLIVYLGKPTVPWKEKLEKWHGALI